MEFEDLIASFKSANQSLRKRAIALGVLMTLAIALRYSENIRFEKVFNLKEYQYSLERIAVLPDSTFRLVVDGDTDLEKEYFSLNELDSENGYHYRLFEKIRLNNYQRELVIKAMDEVDQKIENYNQQQSIGILGLTIPLEPVAYLSLVFVLIVFHDFTQIIIVRNQIYRKIREQNLSRWKLGFEFFGFYNQSNNSTLKFLRFTSSLITGVLIVCPLITSYLMMDLNNSNNVFLFLLNIVCFLLIVIDTIIIFHTENIGNFRYFCNFYLGRHNVGTFEMRMIWGFPLSLMVSVNLALSAILIGTLGTPGIVYCLMSLVPPVFLFFSLIYTQKNPTKRNRAIRSGLLVLNIFLVFITFRCFSIIDRITGHDIDKLGEGFVGILLCCLAYSSIYRWFFMDGKKTRKLRK
ncbi:hypothetical protein D3C71_931980 [compost metagenome]